VSRLFADPEGQELHTPDPRILSWLTAERIRHCWTSHFCATLAKFPNFFL